MKCGIDLGTTYSAISWYDDVSQRLVTVELNCENGNRMIPSIVYYPDSGKDPIVGTYALNARKHSPDRVVIGVKRSMGDPHWRFAVDGKSYTPQEVSAEILKALIREAMQYIQEPITDLVITVPAYFEEAQKNATLEAGELAGIPKDHISLLEEPQAAALAYCIEKAVQIDDRYLLVYDLGGGTFDVVLVHAVAVDRAGARDLKLETLSVDGNRNLGGLNWDTRLADIVERKIQQSDNVNVRNDPVDEAILMENTEQGKRTLSFTSPAFIIGDRTPHEAAVAQTEFEDETAGLLEETRDRMLAVLDDAEKRLGIPRDRVDVLLSGGSTRMPMCRAMIRQSTGKDALMFANPDFLVSMGAAYWAYLDPTRRESNGLSPDIKIKTKAPDGSICETVVTVEQKPAGIAAYAVGIEVADPSDSSNRYNSVMLPRYSKYGADGDVERLFYKTADEMREIRVSLMKSENDTEDLEQCGQLAMFIIGPLPAGGKQGEEVRVSLGHTDNGIICGEAEDMSTHTKVPIRVERDMIERV